MKPLLLTMQAFSTYCQKTIIDFTKLNENGLYLISGETGSGKTTIFDAISFALFREVSGSQRSKDIIRSHFAKDDVETYVDLKFVLHNKIYFVHRCYVQKSKASDKDYLQYDDVIISGITNVNNALKDILKVNFQQFKQIVMIAQGEFTKLLQANSDQRVAIFRDIFNTQKMQNLEIYFHQKVKDLDQDYKVIQNTLDIYYNQLTALEDDFVYTDFEEKKKNITAKEKELLSKKDSLENEKKRLQELRDHYYYQSDIHKKSNELNNLYKQEKELENNRNNINELKAKVNDIEKVTPLRFLEEKEIESYNLYQNLLEEKDKIQSDFISLEDQLNILNAQKESIIGLEREIELLKNELNEFHYLQEKYDTYHKNMQEIQKLKQYLDDITNKSEVIHEKLSKKERQYERDEISLQDYSSLEFQIQTMENETQDFLKRKKKIHDLSDAFDNYLHLEDNLYESHQTYVKMKDQEDRAYARYKSLYESYRHNIYGNIASTLQDNEPCPICGSLHHPHIAQLPSDKITMNDVDKADEKYQGVRKETDAIHAQIQEDKLTLHKQNQIIQSYKDDLDIHEEMSKDVFIYLLNDVEFKFKENKENYQRMVDQKDYLKKLEKTHIQDKIDIDQYKNMLFELKTKQNSLQNKYELLTKINEDLVTQNPKIINFDKNNLNKIQNILNDYQNNCEMYYQNLEEKKTKFTILKTSLENKENEVFKMNKTYKDACKMFEESLISNHLSKEKYQDICLYISKKEALLEEIQEYDVLVKQVKQSIKTYKEALENEVLEDLNVLKQELDDQMTAFEQKKKDILLEDKHIQVQKELSQNIEKTYKKSQKLFETYKTYVTLRDMTSGKNSQKLSFERYVLTSYFDQILEFANVEFERLTNERYRFIRRKEVYGRRGQGLDLDVLDFETGLNREVSSLSGGESFKAALSLALGLSSMIQSYAGGIYLESLFIDEGFGTLDNDSLESAIKVLLDLNSQNKVIGIISHVNELKEKIDTHIEVKHSDKGSTIEIVCR